MTKTICTPNKLYCLGNEEGEFRSNQKIGLMCFRDKSHGHFGIDRYKEREVVETFPLEIKLLYFFYLIDYPFNVIDTFINVDSKDILFANLAFDNSMFLLIETKLKEEKVSRIVIDMNSYNTDLVLATPDQYTEKLCEFNNARNELYDKLIKLCGVNV